MTTQTKSFNINVADKYVDFYIVTPEFAEYLISLNVKNRDINKYELKKIIGWMKSGKWITTHQGILISNTGRLLDGQKRLHAIIATGITVEMQITTGLDDSVFECIDIGQKRNMSDRTGYPRKVAELITFAMRIAGKRDGDVQIAHEMHDAIIAEITKLHDACNTTAKRTSHTPVRLAAICRMIGASSAEEIDYILSTYRALNLRNYEKFTKAMSSFANKVIDIREDPGQYQVFAMAYYLFNIKNKEKRIINLNQVSEDKLMEEARVAINSRFNKGKISFSL